MSRDKRLRGKLGYHGDPNRADEVWFPGPVGPSADVAAWHTSGGGTFGVAVSRGSCYEGWTRPSHVGGHHDVVLVPTCGNYLNWSRLRRTSWNHLGDLLHSQDPCRPDSSGFDGNEDCHFWIRSIDLQSQ
jgi:hypothetical protein